MSNRCTPVKAPYFFRDYSAKQIPFSSSLMITQGTDFMISKNDLKMKEQAKEDQLLVTTKPKTTIFLQLLLLASTPSMYQPFY